MKEYLFSFFTFFILSFFHTSLFSNTGANLEWGLITKKISIERGKSQSAWIDRGWIVAETLEPLGDGTFGKVFYLYPGCEYNFIFFTVTSSDPPKGLKPNTTYYDAVPNYGTDMAFIISTSPTGVNNLGGVRYININGDARRYVEIPLIVDTTLYIFSNWASTPNAPTNFKARPGNKKVFLSWNYPYGHWGKFEEGKAIDVIVGGVYHIFRATHPKGPYEHLKTLPGDNTSYIDTSVVNGRTYYYTIISSDCYKGRLNLTTISPYTVPPPEPNLTWATPNVPIPIRFYIKNIDWEKVKQKEYLVWLTREDELDIYSSDRKIPARIAKVYLKKTIEDYYHEFRMILQDLFTNTDIRAKKKKDFFVDDYAFVLHSQDRY